MNRVRAAVTTVVVAAAAAVVVVSLASSSALRIPYRVETYMRPPNPLATSSDQLGSNITAFYRRHLCVSIHTAPMAIHIFMVSAVWVHDL